MTHKITKIYDMDSDALMTMYMAYLYQYISNVPFKRSQSTEGRRMLNFTDIVPYVNNSVEVGCFECV